jgi:hypothetical protein
VLTKIFPYLRKSDLSNRSRRILLICAWNANPFIKRRVSNSARLWLPLGGIGDLATFNIIRTQALG